MRQSTAGVLDLPELAPATTWFDAQSCVVLAEDGSRAVFVGGRLLGTFGPKDSAERNLLLIAVTEEPQAHYGRIATAFGVSAETIRLLHRLVERSGVAAVTTRKHGGSVSKGLTARDQKKVLAAFEQGLAVEAAWEQIGRRVSRSTVGRMKKEWDARRSAGPAAPVVEEPTQTSLGERLVTGSDGGDDSARTRLRSMRRPRRRAHRRRCVRSR